MTKKKFTPNCKIINSNRKEAIGFEGIYCDNLQLFKAITNPMSLLDDFMFNDILGISNDETKQFLFAVIGEKGSWLAGDDVFLEIQFLPSKKQTLTENSLL